MHRAKGLEWDVGLPASGCAGRSSRPPRGRTCGRPGRRAARAAARRRRRPARSCAGYDEAGARGATTPTLRRTRRPRSCGSATSRSPGPGTCWWSRAHWWRPARKTPLGPSAYQLRCVDAAASSGAEPDAGADAARTGAANPLRRRRLVRRGRSRAARRRGRRAGCGRAERACRAACRDRRHDEPRRCRPRARRWSRQPWSPTGTPSSSGCSPRPGATAPTRSRCRCRSSLSATSLARLRDDPDELARDLARPMPRRPSPAARFGTRFHAWVEATLRPAGPARRPRRPARAAATPRSTTTTDLASWSTRFQAGPFAERMPVAVEPPFALVLAGQVVRGRIDAVYAEDGRSFLVVDWKTNRSQTADPLQLGVYRLAWAELHGVPLERVRAAFYYVRDRRAGRHDDLPGRAELEALVAPPAGSPGRQGRGVTTSDISFPAPGSVDIALSMRAPRPGRSDGVPTRPGSTRPGTTRTPGCVLLAAPGSRSSGTVRRSPGGRRRRRRRGSGSSSATSTASRTSRCCVAESDRPRRAGPASGRSPSGSAADDAGLMVQAHRARRVARRAPVLPALRRRCSPAAAGGHVLTCTECGQQQFPRTDPAVIMLVTDGERALLGRQPRWPAGPLLHARRVRRAGGEPRGRRWSARSPRRSASQVGDVTYFGNQPWPFPPSLMVGFFARAVTTEINVDGDEIERRPLVHPRGDAGRGARPGRWCCPAASRSAGRCRGVVRRPAARLLVSRAVEGSAEGGQLGLDLGDDGLVCAEPSANTSVGTVWLPRLTCSTTQRRVGLLLDVDHAVGDALAVELALEPVAVAAPRGGVHRHGGSPRRSPSRSTGRRVRHRAVLSSRLPLDAVDPAADRRSPRSPCTTARPRRLFR